MTNQIFDVIKLYVAFMWLNIHVCSGTKKKTKNELLGRGSTSNLKLRVNKFISCNPPV